MWTRRFFVMAALLGLAGCAEPRFLTYDGPEVTTVVVQKSQRRLYLLHEEEILRSYEFALGFAPEGHKQFSGDGRTPEGYYYVNRRNPNSAYHLSIGVSYPNRQDRAFAASQGRSPGGDIFIHGTPDGYSTEEDWTAGCIAVTNQAIEEIYAMVKDGTPIFINP